MSSSKTPAGPPALIRKTRKVSLQLRVDFTEKELLEKGRQIAENHRQRAEFEDQLATVKSQFKSKIEGVEAKINELSGHLTAGWEYRPIVCEVRFDEPSIGKKSTYRMDKVEIVGVEDMTLQEQQVELPLTPGVAGIEKSGLVATEGDRE